MLLSRLFILHLQRCALPGLSGQQEPATGTKGAGPDRQNEDSDGDVAGGGVDDDPDQDLVFPSSIIITIIIVIIFTVSSIIMNTLVAN